MDWIAVVLVLVGATLIARKRKIGWLINSAGNLLFVVYFYGKEEWPAFAAALVFTIINSYGYISWRTMDQQPLEEPPSVFNLFYRDILSSLLDTWRGWKARLRSYTLISYVSEFTPGKFTYGCSITPDHWTRWLTDQYKDNPDIYVSILFKCPVYYKDYLLFRDHIREVGEWRTEQNLADTIWSQKMEPHPSKLTKSLFIPEMTEMEPLI